LFKGAHIWTLSEPETIHATLALYEFFPFKVETINCHFR